MTHLSTPKILHSEVINNLSADLYVSKKRMKISSQTNKNSIFAFNLELILLKAWNMVLIYTSIIMSFINHLVCVVI